MKSLSIIIPHHNGYNTLFNCITSLQECINTSNEIEIIVVNNNSTDDSIDKIKNIFHNLIILVSKTNLGYAGGCNYGAKKAKGDNLLFLNNDTEHDPSWIDHLIKSIEDKKYISAVQPKIKNIKNRDSFDYAGACGGFIDILVFPFSRGRIFNTLEKDKGQYDIKRKIFWASGTAFITKKSIFNEVGGFDNYFFAHMEEIDYQWKCQLLGYEVWVEPKSIIYHKGGATLAYKSAYKTYLNHRNSLIMLMTNYSIKISSLLIIPRIILEIISICRDLILLKPMHSIAQLSALIMALIRIDIIIKRKLKINKIRKISDNDLLKNIYKKPILWDYFILGKKKFSEINF